MPVFEHVTGARSVDVVEKLLSHSVFHALESEKWVVLINSIISFFIIYFDIRIFINSFVVFLNNSGLYYCLIDAIFCFVCDNNIGGRQLGRYVLDVRVFNRNVRYFLLIHPLISVIEIYIWVSFGVVNAFTVLNCFVECIYCSIDIKIKKLIFV